VRVREQSSRHLSSGGFRYTRPSVRRRFPILLLPLAAAAAFVLAAAPGPAAPADATPAYHLQKGSVARRHVVALGRDMIVDGQAMSHAVVMSGSIRVSGTVGGDVIVISGDAHLASTAEVAGDVYVLGGMIEAAPGATIGGRSVAYPDASALWMGLLAAPSMGRSAFSPVVLGAQLALLAFWSFMVLLILSIGRHELLSTSESVRTEPFRNFLLGLVGVAAMVLTALFFSAFSGMLLGVPLLVLVAVAALVLRFWGMVAVFHALGEWLYRVLKKRPPLPLVAASYGLIVLGILKLFPWIGAWTWMVATFIGVGAALSTKMGRRQAWFETG